MVVRYDLTEDFAGAVDITPVPDSHEGRYVSYEDYVELERKLRNFAEQVMYAPCSKVTEEMAREILGIWASQLTS